MIVEVPEHADAVETPYHRWMSLAQVHEFVAQGLFSIEARNLLACLPAHAPHHVR